MENNKKLTDKQYKILKTLKSFVDSKSGQDNIIYYQKFKELSLDYNNDFNFYNHSGNNPLMFFLSKYAKSISKQIYVPGYSEDFSNTRNSLDSKILSILFKRTNDFLHQNKQGKTVFSMACSIKSKYLITKLLNKKNAVDLSLKDNKQVSDLMRLVSCMSTLPGGPENQENAVFLKLVFEKIKKQRNNIEIDNQDKKRQTALSIAINNVSAQENFIIINELLGFNPNLNLQDNRGFNILFLAAKKNQEILNSILNKVEQKKVIINLASKDKEGNNILFYVKDPSNFKRLIDLGVSPFLPNNKGVNVIQSIKKENDSFLKLKPIIENIELKSFDFPLDNNHRNLPKKKIL